MQSQPKKIAIVEDEERLARALEFKLNKAGFDTQVFYNGEEALVGLEKEKFDLILLDIIMPKMDGVTMFKHLRASEWGKSIPVIILTNLSEIKAIEEATQGDIAGFLIKSEWSLEDVINKVREKLLI